MNIYRLTTFHLQLRVSTFELTRAPVMKQLEVVEHFWRSW
jgi:hypothetical protein